MSRHEVYYAPKPVPCPCGRQGAYWHDHPVYGKAERHYMCDRCWKRYSKAAVKNDNVRGAR